MAALTLPAPAIVRTIGPIFVGMWVQYLLLGIVFLQATRYYTSGSKRSSHPDAQEGSSGFGLDCRYLVGVLLLLTSVGAVLNFHLGYHAMIVHFGDYTQVVQGTWSLWIGPAITASVGAVTHTFFLERCWRVTKSRATCALLTVLLLLSLGSGVAVSVIFCRLKTVSTLSTIPIPMGLWLCASAGTDMMISVSMSLALASEDEGQAYMAEKALRFIMQTNSMSAVVASLNLILYFTMRGTTFNFIAEFTLPCVYTLTVLANMRARNTASARLSSFAFNNPMKQRTRTVITNVEVKVDRVVEHDGLPDGSVTEPESENKASWSNLAVNAV
ncbi:hypothetical protein C8R46DRAFT_1346342 [Mycena filopes]|nr:hypothetical protein C8R46DRAFT_1346342 [Mycena filopes]